MPINNLSVFSGYPLVASGTTFSTPVGLPEWPASAVLPSTALQTIGQRQPAGGTALQRPRVPLHRLSGSQALVNQQPAGKAAWLFQQFNQAHVLKHPGSILATRENLGFEPEDLAMLDIGGEGQKSEISEKTERVFKTGSAHAINVNALATVSSLPIHLQLEPDDPVIYKTKPMAIPNLVRPANEWPDKKFLGKLLPFEDGFSNITLMQGAPVYPYHVQELARVTDKNGWLVLEVDESFKPHVEALAQRHNGKESNALWQMPVAQDNDLPRFVIPPAWAHDGLRSHFEHTDSHALYDLIKSLQAAADTPSQETAVL